MNTEENKKHYNKGMLTQKEVFNDAAILTSVAVGVSYLGRKIGGKQLDLGLSTTPLGVAKLAIALGVSTVSLKMLKDKIPENPWKE